MNSLRPIAFLLTIIIASCVTNAADRKSRLADAVEKRDRAAIAALLSQHAEVNASQVDGMTALHWAAYHDDTATAKRLIAAGAKPKSQNRYGVTPLAIACKNGNAEIVQLLLKAGADANATLRGGESALMTAARTGKPGPVKSLLAHGAKVNAKDRKGQTAIMWAAAEGNLDVVDALLSANAEFRKPLRSGFTPFFFAVREGRTAVTLRLLKAGIKVNDVMRPAKSAGKKTKSGLSPLLLAVENGHFELATALLKAGANPKDQRAGYTALHALTWVRKPLRGDGDPPPIGSGNVSSLAFARQLVAAGADVNARHAKHRSGGGRLNRTDATPFLLAAQTGDLPLMKLLLKLGADPKLTNADNCTPLLVAAGVGILSNGDESAGTETEAIEAIKLLLKLGADVNAVDDNGESAMHGAAYKSWNKLIAFIAANGADVKVWNRKNKRKWTPLMIAQGHRPGNFRPSPETITAIRRVLGKTDDTPSPRKIKSP